MKFKIYRFAAKHRFLSGILSGVFLCTLYSFILMRLDAPPWLIILVDIPMALLGALYPQALGSKLIAAAVKSLENDCDPEPLYTETKALLDPKRNDAYQQLLLIDHCLALREMGQWQQAMDIMKTINIDQHAGTLPYAKAVYYNNLSDLCDLLGDNAAADIWYGKMMQIYNDMPDNRLKKQLAPAIPDATAAYHARNGRYDESMACAKQMTRDNRHRTVYYALAYGRASIGLKDYENARKSLEYAAANGKKSCAVQIARNMLAQLDELEKEENKASEETNGSLF